MDGRSSCDDWKGAALSPFLALDSVVTASTPDSVAPAGIRFLISGLALSVFLTVTTIAMLGPLLVDMSQDMGAAVPLMAQLVAVASGMWAITALLAGPCSDAYGRKPVLLLGLCLLAAGCRTPGTLVSGSARAANPLAVRAGNDDVLWERTVDVLHDYQFQIVREDRLARVSRSSLQVAGDVLVEAVRSQLDDGGPR